MYRHCCVNRFKWNFKEKNTQAGKGAPGYTWCRDKLRWQLQSTAEKSLQEIDRCVDKLTEMPEDEGSKKSALTYLKEELNDLNLSWGQSLLELLGFDKRTKLLDKIQRVWDSLNLS